MAVSVFQWMQMPASHVVKIHSPNSFVLLDKGKGCGTGEFIKVDLQKRFFLSIARPLKTKTSVLKSIFSTKSRSAREPKSESRNFSISIVSPILHSAFSEFQLPPLPRNSVQRQKHRNLF